MKHKLWVFSILLVLIGLGTLLRAPGVWLRPLWFDEADTWRFSVATEADLEALRFDSQPAVTPADPTARAIPYASFLNWTNHFENAPLGYLLPRIAADLTGSTAEPILRLPALIAGLLCIPLAYLLGRIAAGPGVGLLAALLLTVDPNMVDQAQQARMYPLLAMFTLLAVTLSILILRQPQRAWLRSAALGLSLAGALWSTLLGTMLWAGIALGPILLLAAGWLLRRPHPQWKQVITQLIFAYLIGTTFGCIGLWHTLHRYLHGPDRGGKNMPLSDIARETLVGLKDLIHPHSPASLIVYALAIVGLLLLARRCKTSAAVLLGLTLGVMILMVPFRRSHRFTDPRYFTILQPALWLSLAALALGWSMMKSQVQTKTPRLGPSAWVGLTLVLLLSVFLGWQSFHIERWWQQPDRYDLARTMIRIRVSLLAKDALAVTPPVADQLAVYYRLKLDPLLNRAFRSDYQPTADPKIPAGFSAPSTLLIAGMLNDNTKLAPASPFYPGHFLQALARHYHVEISPPEMQKHIRRDQVLVVRMSARGVEWLEGF